MTNIKKAIDLHNKITSIEKVAYNLDNDVVRNIRVDEYIKEIGIACIKLKSLIETNNVKFK
tara:strand:+ start:737 stop:919 length:183 start_codon:yes stop_codon:yes gene_type:complete